MANSYAGKVVLPIDGSWQHKVYEDIEVVGRIGGVDIVFKGEVADALVKSIQESINKAILHHATLKTGRQ